MSYLQILNPKSQKSGDTSPFFVDMYSRYLCDSEEGAEVVEGRGESIPTAVMKERKRERRGGGRKEGRSDGRKKERQEGNGRGGERGME